MEWYQVLTIILSIFGGVAYLHADMSRQGARTDKLYEMFIDLLKSRPHRERLSEKAPKGDATVRTRRRKSWR